MFKICKENGRIKLNFLGLKIVFKNPLINQLEDCCCIENLSELKKINTNFPHPIGIVISKSASFGNNCTVFQNVTIGKQNPDDNKAPAIGNNVKIYANSVDVGDIKIGNNVIIGANSFVNKDIEDGAICVGNPAKIIKYQEL